MGSETLFYFSHSYGRCGIIGSLSGPGRPAVLQTVFDPKAAMEQYPWVVPYLLIKADTRQATRTLDDRNISVMRRITPMSTDDRHDGASHRLAVTRTSYLRCSG